MMIELEKPYWGLIEEICEDLNISNEIVEIKDKYYLETDLLLEYIDELYRAYVDKVQKIDDLQGMMNEDMYDRYYERGGFPL